MLACIVFFSIMLNAWLRLVPRQPFNARLSFADALLRLPTAPPAQQVAAVLAKNDASAGDGAAVAALRRWVSSIGLHEAKVFSQYGEDGVINFIFSNIGTTDKYFVEFGTMNGDECATRFLFEAHHWKGLLMDGSNEIAARSLHKEFIYAHNIVSLFEKYHVPKTFDFLSVDIDGHDYHVLKALRHKRGGKLSDRPRPCKDDPARRPSYGLGHNQLLRRLARSNVPSLCRAQLLSRVL